MNINTDVKFDFKKEKKRKKKGGFGSELSYSVNTGIKTGATSLIIFLRS